MSAVPAGRDYNVHGNSFSNSSKVHTDTTSTSPSSAAPQASSQGAKAGEASHIAKTVQIGVEPTDPEHLMTFYKTVVVADMPPRKDEASLVTELRLDKDPHSNAELDKVRVKHVDVEIKEIDWKGKSLHMQVSLQYRRTNTDHPYLMLDQKDLEIESVRVNGKEVDFETGNTDNKATPPFLKVPFGDNKEDGEVVIKYKTGKEALGNALFFLSKEQTGGKHPALFTQQEDTTGPFLWPVQYSVQSKISWNLTINTSNPDLIPVVSAYDNPIESNGTDHYEGLRQPHKLSPYLMGIQVGEFVGHSFNAEGTLRAYAPKQDLDQVRDCFKVMEEVFQKATELFGPTPFKQYGAIYVGSRYPYSAMEHILMTTCGGETHERATVLIHEIMHNWFGNAVTCDRWEQIWMNEGFCEYGTYKVIEAIYGKDLADLYCMEMVESAQLTIQEQGEKMPGSCCLEMHTNTESDGTPGFSRIPYGKGMLFLLTLEKDIDQQFGEGTFAEMIKNYNAVFFQRSVNTKRFLAFLAEELRAKRVDPEACFKEVEIDLWLHQAEFPKSAIQLESQHLKDVNATVESIMKREPVDLSSWNETPLKIWTMLSKLQTRLAQLPDQKEALAIVQKLKESHDYKNADLLATRIPWARVLGTVCDLSEQDFIRDVLLRRNQSITCKEIATGMAKSEEGRAFLLKVSEEPELFASNRDLIRKIATSA